MTHKWKIKVVLAQLSLKCVLMLMTTCPDAVSSYVGAEWRKLIIKTTVSSKAINPK